MASGRLTDPSPNPVPAPAAHEDDKRYLLRHILKGLFQRLVRRRPEWADRLRQRRHLLEETPFRNKPPLRDAPDAVTPLKTINISHTRHPHEWMPFVRSLDYSFCGPDIGFDERGE
jgi:hypothetical protein